MSAALLLMSSVRRVNGVVEYTIINRLHNNSLLLRREFMVVDTARFIDTIFIVFTGYIV